MGEGCIEIGQTKPFSEIDVVCFQAAQRPHHSGVFIILALAKRGRGVLIFVSCTRRYPTIRREKGSMTYYVLYVSMTRAVVYYVT